jgi:hypothetical protein
LVAFVIEELMDLSRYPSPTEPAFLLFKVDLSFFKQH